MVDFTGPTTIIPCTGKQEGRKGSPVLTRRQLLAAGAATFATTAALRATETEIGIDNMLPGEFTWHPERSPQGPVAVIASLPEQRVHVYRNGVRIAVSTCSSGKPGHETPTGVFTVLQKDARHRSSTYNNAPMPNMNRLTWDGIAMHAGNLPGYPASHGCLRLPLEFSRLLFTVTHIGTPVVVAGAASDPWELVHPGLVLAALDEDELAQAVSELAQKKRPDDWSATPPYPITTVLATRADNRITIMEDGREVYTGPMTIAGDGPVGEHALLLLQGRDGALHWSGITHHPDPSHPLRGEAQVLNRVTLPQEALAELRGRLHPGLTFIISELPSTPDRRSGEDFVIMTGETLSSPRPPATPERN